MIEVVIFIRGLMFLERFIVIIAEPSFKGTCSP